MAEMDELVGEDRKEIEQSGNKSSLEASWTHTISVPLPSPSRPFS